jgi:hypothetical protein
MKKILLVVLAVIVVSVGFWFFKKAEAPVDSQKSTFKSAALGITFDYPKILAVKETGGRVSVHHEVPFVHHDYCDFKGEGDTTLPIMPDFHLDMFVVSKNITQSMKQESPYIPEENFVNGVVVPSPGFIDESQYGNLNGFAIFEGAEGCGQTTHYFKLTDSKTLIVRQKMITVFTGAIAVDQKDKAEDVPGVINKEKESFILSNLLESVQID